MIKIIVGNKKYSSWSMRPWIALKHTGAPFEEEVIGLDLPDTDKNIRRYSAAGRVPILIDDGLTVWDTISICEYLAEKFPAARLWPEDPKARAVARSVCAEMHSGFQSLRGDLPMKLIEPLETPAIRDETNADIKRITSLWTELRGKYGQGGSYLFGHFTIADAFYAPVAIGRFRTYSVPLEGVAKEYVATLSKDQAVKAWLEGARQETLRAKRYEP